MPVEDLHFLAENSVEEQFIMYVDSSRRDRQHFPAPAQYTVTFAEPFRYVIGLEVLDVLVPRTMYNVDTDVNTLTVDFGAGVGRVELQVDPADYSVETIADGINNAASRALGVRAEFYAEPKTPDMPTMTGKLVFSASRPFTLDLGASSMREVIGFDENCRTGAKGYRMLGPTTAGSIAHADPEPETIVYRGLPLEVPATVREGDTMAYSLLSGKNCVIESLKLAVEGLPHRVELRRSPDGPDEFPYVQARVSYTLTITLLGEADVVSETETADFIAEMSTAGVSLLTRLVLRPTQHTLEPPGLVVLTGHRCIMLRCPEIEQHINSSYIYGDNSPGIALIKLATRGYTQQRYDFQSIRYRQFQPIAKLQKVTFRFETVAGELYDFKGCNHTMLIAIKYLEPQSPRAFKDFAKHSLNPNYNPDFVQYIVNARRNLPPSDNEEEEEEDEDAEEDITTFAHRYGIFGSNRR